MTGRWLLRTFDAALLTLALLLAGCGERGHAPQGNSRSFLCGPQGKEPAESCLLEVQDEGGTLRLTLHRPDGGFRRLVWPKGNALASADGAERLETAPLPGGGVEARIGGWVYRIERAGGGLP